jgi:hypothetical protein
MKFRSMILFLMLVFLGVIFENALDAFAKEDIDTADQTEITPGSIRKPVGAALFINGTAFQDSRIVTITDKTITDSLRESCPDVALVADENPDFSELRNKQPRRVSGNIDNLTLAMQGRKLGLNAILTGEITEIKGVQEELGYLWFKEMVFFVHVHMLIDIYDTETGTKLLEKYVSEEEEISEDAYYKIKSRNFEPAFPAIENLLVSLSGKLADEACERMEDEPLKTYVKSTEGEKITICAGRNTGIRKGSLFTIHDDSRIMLGKDGYKYLVPGPDTGKLRVDAVYEDFAEGLIVEGEIKGTDPCLKLFEE